MVDPGPVSSIMLWKVGAAVLVIERRNLSMIFIYDILSFHNFDLIN